ncbi:bacteriophage terminase-like protein, large subunit [Spiroplasma kunkelii CR2-3x]|uniref:Bacteriophage terminase-like protein, large subunit n=1 Tax=Spiroplasma kunkelii CR2-3x TaxID=273035 RepID=A0A0K2JIX7_SPIKU|nr:terminase large subunit [Spiroplasma kunkelii]ALA98383.1 bacteriophage terminase-like protein, large subunit [Spiroplasma kunkelii CR2-3x]
MQANNEKTNLELYHEWMNKNSNKNKVGIKIKKIVSTLVKELKSNKDYYFNHKEANKTISFIEKSCFHTTGEYNKQNFKLELWQKAFLEALYGFYNKKTNLRRFKEALLIVGRGNGKTALASAIALKSLILDNEANAELYSIATKRDQAKRVYEEMRRMIFINPNLNKILKVKRDKIEFIHNNSFFQPLSSETKTLDGLNPYFVVLDEVAMMEKRDIYDVMRTATAKRKDYLMLLITTNGSIRENIFDERYSYAEKVLKNTIKDNKFLPWIYELDERNEWKNFNNLYKANPNLGISKYIDNFKAEWQEALITPTQQPNFLIKHCNLKSNLDSALFSRLDLETKNNKIINTDEYLIKNRICTIGIDLSKTNDLSAVIFLIPNLDTNEFILLSQFFMPEARIIEKTTEDKIPYKLYQEQGILTLCKGEEINISEIVNYIINIMKKYNLICYGIGYDTFNSYLLKQHLDNAGFYLINNLIRFGVRTISPIIKALKLEFDDNKFVFNQNPLLKLHFNNVDVLIDEEKENMMPIKRSKNKRIDGFIALLFAYKIFRDNKDRIYIELYKIYSQK